MLVFGGEYTEKRVNINKTLKATADFYFINPPHTAGSGKQETAQAFRLYASAYSSALANV